MGKLNMSPEELAQLHERQAPHDNPRDGGDMSGDFAMVLDNIERAAFGVGSQTNSSAAISALQRIVIKRTAKDIRGMNK